MIKVKVLIILFLILLTSCKHQKTIEFQNVENYSTQRIEHVKAKLLFDEAHYLITIGELDKARYKLRSALGYEINSIIYVELGIADLIEKKYEKAIFYFQQGINADNTYWPSYINKARAEYSLSKYDEGIATLKTMLNVCSSNYWISYAKLYLALGYFNNGNDCEEAVKFINQSKSLKMYPELLNQIISLEEKINKACI